MSRRKYENFNRSDFMRQLNIERWKDQSSKLQEAIASKKCSSCGESITFSRKPTWQQLEKRKFCYGCASSTSSARQTQTRFEKSKTGRGYLTIWIDNQKVLEHVHIAEEVLGRKLKSNEVVHHMNGRRDDNRKSNLMITTRGYHSWLHTEMVKSYKRSHPEFVGSAKEAGKLYMESHFG